MSPQSLDLISGKFFDTVFYDYVRTNYLNGEWAKPEGVILTKMLRRGRNYYLFAANRETRNVLIKINFLKNRFEVDKYKKALASYSRNRFTPEVSTFTGYWEVKSSDSPPYIIEEHECLDGNQLYDQIIQNAPASIERLRWLGQYVDLNQKLLNTPSLGKSVNRDFDLQKNFNWFLDTENTSNVITGPGMMKIFDLQDVIPFEIGHQQEYTRELVRALIRILFNYRMERFNPKGEYDSTKDNEWVNIQKLAALDYGPYLDVISKLIVFLRRSLDEKWSYENFFRNWKTEGMGTLISTIRVAANNEKADKAMTGIVETPQGEEIRAKRLALYGSLKTKLFDGTPFYMTIKDKDGSRQLPLRLQPAQHSIEDSREYFLDICVFPDKNLGIFPELKPVFDIEPQFDEYLPPKGSLGQIRDRPVILHAGREAQIDYLL